MRPAVPDAQLWMVSEDCPPAPGVLPLGRLSDEELVDRYHRAWVFCLPSSYEGVGIPYVEALAAGLPVVATPNAGARFVLDGGRAGVLAPDAELGTALVRLLGDAAERERLAKVGEERAAAFDLGRIADRYEDAYYDLLAPQPAVDGAVALGHLGPAEVPYPARARRRQAVSELLVPEDAIERAGQARHVDRVDQQPVDAVGHELGVAAPLEAITGRPARHASRTTIPNDSRRLGIT